MKKTNKKDKNLEPLFWTKETDSSVIDFQEVTKKLGYEYFIFFMEPVTGHRGKVIMHSVGACCDKDLNELMRIGTLEHNHAIGVEKIELSELMGFPENEKLN